MVSNKAHICIFGSCFNLNMLAILDVTHYQKYSPGVLSNCEHLKQYGNVNFKYLPSNLLMSWFCFVNVSFILFKVSRRLSIFSSRFTQADPTNRSVHSKCMQDPILKFIRKIHYKMLCFTPFKVLMNSVLISVKAFHTRWRLRSNNIQ